MLCLNKNSITQNVKKEKLNNQSTIKTICNGIVKEWDSQEKAEKFFIDCLQYSEGTEKERYLNILSKLNSGIKICDDK